MTYDIAVQGVYMGTQVYLIENVKGLDDAKETARNLWWEGAKAMGLHGAIMDVRKATEKDMRLVASAPRVEFDGN